MSHPLVLTLLRGEKTVIDAADLPKIAHCQWYLTSTKYVGSTLYKNGEKGTLLLHRFLTDAPPGSHVDHINGDKLDNRQANLRVTTPSLNQVNRKRLSRNNRSGFRGIDWVKRQQRWRAQITVNGKNTFLGHFKTIEEAFARRRQAEIEMWGEQCPLP